MSYIYGWIGFHEEGIKAFASLLQKGIAIKALFTLPPNLAKKKSGASLQYESLCKQYGVEVYYIEHVNHPDTINQLKNLQLDLVFVIGWGQILSREALATTRFGMVGAHASLLPHLRGSAPINWAIIKGEVQTGNTLMRLSPEVDQGDILAQKVFDITVYDNCQTLYEKVAQSNETMILSMIEQLEKGKLIGTPQTFLQEPLLPRRTSKDGIIDWNQPSYKVYNFIRALTRPYPGAFTYLKTQEWKIWKVSLLPTFTLPLSYPAGSILGATFSPTPDACGIVVACAEGCIQIHEIEDREGNVYAGSHLTTLTLKGVFSS